MNNEQIPVPELIYLYLESHLSDLTQVTSYDQQRKLQLYRKDYEEILGVVLQTIKEYRFRYDITPISLALNPIEYLCVREFAKHNLTDPISYHNGCLMCAGVAIVCSHWGLGILGDGDVLRVVSKDNYEIQKVEDNK